MSEVTTVVLDKKSIENLKKIYYATDKSKSAIIRYLINNAPINIVEELKKKEEK